jgi:hypothetical protein
LSSTAACACICIKPTVTVCGVWDVDIEIYPCSPPLLREGLV